MPESTFLKFRLMQKKWAQSMKCIWRHLIWKHFPSLVGHYLIMLFGWNLSSWKMCLFAIQNLEIFTTKYSVAGLCAKQSSLVSKLFIICDYNLIIIAWSTACILSEGRHKIVFIDDILFKEPVEIGSVLLCSSQVSFSC